MVARKQSRTPQGRFCTKRRDVRHLVGCRISRSFGCFGKRLIDIVAIGGVWKASSTGRLESSFR
ncbi:MAG: hypothetical protein E6776_03125, partial [Eggerthella sp.]|nr:hypothetical protein [Eggerthella sp.]